MRWKRLPSALWRRHRVVSTVTLAALLASALGLASLAGSTPEPVERPPRLLLNRVWFDRLPESARDEIQVWIWLAGGIGVYQSGSSFRASIDVFDFERTGRSVAMTFLQDGAQASTEITIESCDDLPPFDLCLTLSDSPRGARRYYGFGGYDEMVTAVPWSPRVLAAARAHAGAE